MTAATFKAPNALDWIARGYGSLLGRRILGRLRASEHSSTTREQLVEDAKATDQCIIDGYVATDSGRAVRAPKLANIQLANKDWC